MLRLLPHGLRVEVFGHFGRPLRVLQEGQEIPDVLRVDQLFELNAVANVPLSGTGKFRAESYMMFRRLFTNAAKSATRGFTRLQGLVPLEETMASDGHC